jgi:hypothetical protein
MLAASVVSKNLGIHECLRLEDGGRWFANRVSPTPRRRYQWSRALRCARSAERLR